jgi:serpin B
MKTLTYGVFLLALLFNATSLAKADLAEGNNQFAIKLFHELPNSKTNFFYSPFSIRTALAMTYAGSKKETASQMAKVLGFTEGDDIHQSLGTFIKDLTKPDENSKVDIVIANALWGQKGFPFLPEFKALNKKYYDGGMEEVNFAQSEETAKLINDWVEKQTWEKITNLVPPGILNKKTKLVLTNAMYFKEAWNQPFTATATENSPFYAEGGNTPTVPIMFNLQTYSYGENEEAQWLEIPYQGHRMTMAIFLPKKKDGLPDFEKKLNGNSLDKLLSSSKYSMVKAYIPRFKVTSNTPVTKPLKKMGMELPFQPGRADFSGMAKLPKGEDLYISDVLHKAFVSVDEKGTEAAAATAVIMKMHRAAVSAALPMTFRADHPFLFLIRHKETGVILFMGHVANPLLD